MAKVCSDTHICLTHWIMHPGIANPIRWFSKARFVMERNDHDSFEKLKATKPWQSTLDRIPLHSILAWLLLCIYTNIQNEFRFWQNYFLVYSTSCNSLRPESCDIVQVVIVYGRGSQLEYNGLFVKEDFTIEKWLISEYFL